MFISEVSFIYNYTIIYRQLMIFKGLISEVSATVFDNNTKNNNNSNNSNNDSIQKMRIVVIIR